MVGLFSFLYYTGYKSYNQNDSLLFPHCIGDFIPENDIERLSGTLRSGSRVSLDGVAARGLVRGH